MAFDNNGAPAAVVWATPKAESTIAYIARVSSNNQENPEYDRLFRFLIEHDHWSPFEHAVVCMELNTTRAIAAQILRHRSFSFQEFSQRYETVHHKPKMPEQRFKAKTNRQGSVEPDGEYTAEQRHALWAVQESIDKAWGTYQYLVDNGFAPETARMILPLCTPTRMYMTGTVRSWIHYLGLRLEENTQKEHRELAKHVKDALKEVIPTIIAMLEQKGQIK
jgi:thymidylate synthase (FAD)